MTTPDELMQSVNEFHAVIDQAKHGIGSSPIAELLLLEVLIDRYPEQARRKLADHDVNRGSQVSAMGGC